MPIECTTDGSAGAVRNLIELRAGGGEAGPGAGRLALLCRARRGPVRASSAPDRQVRALFTLVTETVNVLTRADEPAASLARPARPARQHRRARLGHGGHLPPADGRARLDRRRLRRLHRLSHYAARHGLVQRRHGRHRVRRGQSRRRRCRTRPSPATRGWCRSPTRSWPRSIAAIPSTSAAVIPGGTYPPTPDPTPTIGSPRDARRPDGHAAGGGARGDQVRARPPRRAAHAAPGLHPASSSRTITPPLRVRATPSRRAALLSRARVLEVARLSRTAARDWRTSDAAKRTPRRARPPFPPASRPDAGARAGAARRCTASGNDFAARPASSS